MRITETKNKWNPVIRWDLYMILCFVLGKVEDTESKNKSMRKSKSVRMQILPGFCGKKKGKI